MVALDTPVVPAVIFIVGYVRQLLQLGASLIMSPKETFEIESLISAAFANAAPVHTNEKTTSRAINLFMLNIFSG
ncbi:hypothetical protein ACVIKO_000141 [Rhizobium ruizarguesonis]